ncbi:MAG TPA: hypothetical protein VHA75_19350, partial [Rugosimonospora sp.]|nr:hypothetical protein [Rugosimonospora sp.]
MTGPALVLVGHGRYSDPWHDDAAVGHLVADELAAAGIRPVLRGTLPATLDELPDERWSLVVTKAANGPAYDDDALWTGFRERFVAILATGVPLLVLHQAGNSFGNPPEYARAVGGRWVERSWHPAIGEATFRPVDAEHP